MENQEVIKSKFSDPNFVHNYGQKIKWKKNPSLKDLFSEGKKKTREKGKGIWYRIKERYGFCTKVPPSRA